MVLDTDREPRPRLGARGLPRILPDWPSCTDWPRTVRAPEVDFLRTLHARRSSIGREVGEEDLASLLRLGTMLRSRRFDGRFGEWESRTAPSAGGMHAVTLLVLPIGRGPTGIYDDARHCLLAPPNPESALEINRNSVGELCGATTGTTIQLLADGRRYAACYEDQSSLMWRDAGALVAVLALISTALSLHSVVLGRKGGDIAKAAGLGKWTAVGAIHIGA